MLKYSARFTLDDHIQVVAALEAAGTPAALALASRLNRTCLSVVRRGEKDDRVKETSAAAP